MKLKLIYISLLLILILALQSCDNKYSDIDDPIAFLKTTNFIIEEDGETFYCIEELDTINGDFLFYLVQRTNNFSTKNVCLQLKILGLSLPDMTQRKVFTAQYLEKYDDYPSDFVLLEKYNSLFENSRFKEAFTYFANSLNSEQTYRVLEFFGFLFPRSTERDGQYSIHDEKIEHLSDELLLIFIKNLNKGATSNQEKLFSKRIQQIINKKTK